MATTAARPAPVVRAAGLTKRYGELTAVDHLDLELVPGEVFGLLGPNGAGKTTTILMLLGLTEPTEGSCEVAGLDPVRNPLAVKRHVGYLPDNVGFYGTMTGRQNLRYTARLNGIDGPAADARVDELLDRVGLGHAGDQRVDTSSRGMRQRLGIADALVKDPTIVILDEPTIAIDPEGVVEVLGLIRSLADDQGVCVMLSSHLLYQVEAICDRVGIFVKGTMVAQGPKDELAKSFAGDREVIEVTVEPGHRPADVTAALTAAAPDATIEVDPTNPSRFTVTATEDVRSAAVLKLVEAGIGVVGIGRHEAALDEIYRRYFHAEDDAASTNGRRP